MEEFTEITKALIYSIISIVGGIVCYISTTQTVTWKDLFIKGISSGFAGTLIGLLCIYWNFPETLTYFLCGTFGYLGSEATLNLIKRQLLRKISKL